MSSTLLTAVKTSHICNLICRNSHVSSSSRGPKIHSNFHNPHFVFGENLVQLAQKLAVNSSDLPDGGHRTKVSQTPFWKPKHRRMHQLHFCPATPTPPISCSLPSRVLSMALFHSRQVLRVSASSVMGSPLPLYWPAGLSPQAKCSMSWISVQSIRCHHVAEPHGTARPRL